ncbi:MAG: hypothetical protein ACK4SY_08770 [Pyrobaculum sp.]
MFLDREALKKLALWCVGKRRCLEELLAEATQPYEAPPVDSTPIIVRIKDVKRVEELCAGWTTYSKCISAAVYTALRGLQTTVEKMAHISVRLPLAEWRAVDRRRGGKKLQYFVEELIEAAERVDMSYLNWRGAPRRLYLSPRHVEMLVEKCEISTFKQWAGKCVNALLRQTCLQ